MIHYNGKDYETRVITIRPHGVKMPVTVAKMELWNDIKVGVYKTCSEEMAIDSHICYYCNEEEWAMSNKRLAKMLEAL